MRTETAIRTILQAMPDRVFVCANGLISRWAWQISEGSNVFPMLGSMGLAQSIALGLSIARPSTPVGIINGDGNLLMEPSATILVGSRSKLNLVHFCINNGAYASTGGQPTIARPGLLSKLARTCGYEVSEVVRKKRELHEFCGQVVRKPQFCEVLVDIDPSAEPERVYVACSQVSDTIRTSLMGDHYGN